MIGGRRRNVLLLWKLCLIPKKECDTQRTTFPSFENRNNFDMHYIPPNFIPLSQSQVSIIKNKAVIQPEAQEMHFEIVNKEVWVRGVKIGNMAGLSEGGGIPINTIIAQ